MLRKVRLANNTSDQTSLRIYVEHFDVNTRLVADVPSGQYVQNNHMAQGHRGVIVYDDFTEEIIAVDRFTLKNSGVKVVVSGDAATGYTVSFADIM